MKPRSRFAALSLLFTVAAFAGSTPVNLSLVSTVNPALLGTTVQLSASVSPITATGSITLYDGVTMLGVSYLRNASVTINSLFETAGKHSITAYYSGDATYAASTSAPLVETILQPRANGFTEKPALGASETYYLLSITTGDFNQDGKLDLAATECGDQALTCLVQIFIGNGDGTFSGPSSNYVGEWPNSVAVGDFNGDGRLDLAVANAGAGSTNVGILLGNGDGTFQGARFVNTGTNDYLSNLVVADFNRDGKADIAVTSSSTAGGLGAGVMVLLGNGDGTFGAPTMASSGGGSPYALAAADFNGDGYADLAVQVRTTANDVLAVILGNGDGTFQAPNAYMRGEGLGSVGVGDFNGDGKMDVAVCNSTDSDFSIYLGNGDGTFQGPTYYAVPDISDLAVADIDGDGHPDIVAYSEYGIQTMLNNQFGTFVYGPLYSANEPSAMLGVVAVGDWNGDGRPDAAALQFDTAGIGPNSLLSIVAQSFPGSSVILQASPNPSQVTFPVSLTAAVTPATATGSVSFVTGGTFLGTGGLNAGVAQFATTALPLGTDPIYAVYSGDSQNSFSESASISQVVNKITTTTALTSAPNPSLPGQTVTLTAQVSPGTATGKVSFHSGSTTLGTVTLSGGQASMNTSTLAIGSYRITASYGGDASDLSSNSPSVTQVVSNPVTTTTLTSSPNPSGIGQTVTFVATVTGSGTTPTGTVTLMQGSTTAGTAQLSSGKASFMLSLSKAGTYNYTAAYAGDSLNAPSTSTTLTQTVGKFATTTALMASPNPAYLNQPVVLTAQVAGSGSPAPTGAVYFYSGSNKIGTSALSSGTAQFTERFTALGAQTLTASYQGDASNAASTTPAVQQSVVVTPTTMTVTSSSPSASYSKAVTFTARVKAAFGSVPNNETVSFTDNGSALGSAPLSSGGADLTVSTLGVGSHTIGASYGGDGTFTPSSGSASQTITQRKSSTTVTSNVNPAAYGQNITLSANVVPNPAGAAPTGTVTFSSKGQVLGQAPLVSGTASLKVSTLPVGGDNITAAYSGDAVTASSNSPVFTETINPAPTTTTIASSPNPSQLGAPVTLTATVTSSSGATVTGQVMFTAGSTILQTVPLGNAGPGQASIQTSALPAGANTVTATYTGAKDFGGSSGSVTQTVN